MKSKNKQYYDQNAALYDKLLAPVDGTLTKWRKELVKDAFGKTLEVGIGTGKNIRHYPPGITLTGIDSSEKMLKYAHRRANGYTHIDRIVKMNAEELIFPDNTFDTVVASCVFCSVSDPIKGFQEIKRVCKQNGTILLLEHVRSQKKIQGIIMDFLNPISYGLYGDNINRKTYDNLVVAGFDPSQIEAVNIWSDIWQIFRIKNN
ncbi:MAG: class I SAM-dependent methyltransferase [Proteiniphilum sp.]|nr:class I SAM-dependent methyltransferase [Proteiniphilum sp.]